MQTHPPHYPTDLTAEEWNQLESLVPAPTSGKGKRGRAVARDRRRLLDAISQDVCSGWAGRFLPRDLGPWPSVYGSFRAGSQGGTWGFMPDVLRDCGRKTAGRTVAPHGGQRGQPQSGKTPDPAGERGADAGKKISGRKAPRSGGLSGLDAGGPDDANRGARARRGAAFDPNAGE